MKTVVLLVVFLLLLTLVILLVSRPTTSSRSCCGNAAANPPLTQLVTPILSARAEEVPIELQGLRHPGRGARLAFTHVDVEFRTDGARCGGTRGVTPHPGSRGLRPPRRASVSERRRRRAASRPPTSRAARPAPRS